MYSRNFKNNIIKFAIITAILIGSLAYLNSFMNESIAVNTLNNYDRKTNVESANKSQGKVKTVNGKPLMFFHPTCGGVVTSSFGERWGKFHKGIDIGKSLGDDVLSCLDGTVKSKFYEKDGYGNIIIIDHGNGLESRYAHLNGFNVNVGDKVEGGSKIATVGNTGRSTGPHLHFEMRINDKPINPQNYIGE